MRSWSCFRRMITRQIATYAVLLHAAWGFKVAPLKLLPSNGGVCAPRPGLTRAINMCEKTPPSEAGWWRQLTTALFPSAEERRKAEVEWRRRQEGRRRVDPLPKKVVHLRVFIIACTKRASPAVQRS
jgi:hypothetical protein